MKLSNGRRCESATRSVIAIALVASTMACQLQPDFDIGYHIPKGAFDLRIDKRAVWNKWLLDFYVDILNSTVAPESGGIVGPDAG